MSFQFSMRSEIYPTPSSCFRRTKLLPLLLYGSTHVFDFPHEARSTPPFQYETNIYDQENKIIILQGIYILFY